MRNHSELAASASFSMRKLNPEGSSSMKKPNFEMRSVSNAGDRRKAAVDRNEYPIRTKEYMLLEEVGQGVGGSLSLIGHSAGGWLARVYMEEFGLSHISLLLTLGSPHSPPPKGLSGVIDQTRGLLDYVDKYCAQAVYTPELRYVCVAGRYIQGARFFGNPSITSEPMVPIDNDQQISETMTLNNSNKTTSLATTIRARFIGQGYKQVCGQADVWGDGVVPEISAYLEGALNISLEGVYHSPVGSDDVLRPWYGSPAVLEKWVHHLLS